jgi:hypothetical protein
MPNVCLRYFLLAPFAIFTIVAGCGGTSADTACSDSAAARCAQIVMCSNGTILTRTYGDMATCLTREKLACTDALAAPDNGNSPARVEQCLAAVKTESCSDYFSGNTPPACINTGPRADDTACAFNGQCMSSYCTGLSNAACGTCGQPVASGADCSSGGTCARGQVCFSATTASGTPTLTCLTPSGAGGACDRTQPCITDFNCVGAVNTPTNPTMGMCVAAINTAGAACDPIQRTMAGCDRNMGLFCNTTSKSCTAITYAADGAACGIGSDGSLVDCANGTCFGSTIIGANPTMGTCKANAADGAACDTNNGPDCLSPARCVTASGSSTGTCELADGKAC